jgi:sugar/nucleoside kinase (ribokinase family)
MLRPSNVIAIETSIVDLHYPAVAPRENLKQAFISALPRLIQDKGYAAQLPMREAPRKGDMAIIPAEVLDDLCLHFAAENKLAFAANVPDHAKPALIRETLWGKPTSHAGGSLANTFDAMVYSRMNGMPLYTGTFVTSVGKDDAGQYFKDSFAGHIRCAQGGRQIVSHILPVDDDRIMLTTPSISDSQYAYFDINLLDDNLLADADVIMIGGYLDGSGMLERVVDRVRAVYGTKTQYKMDLPSPQLIVTLASQSVAAKYQLGDFPQNIDLTIHGNTGEFRRFLKDDTKWRERFANSFIDAHGQPLQGREAERAKNTNANYINAKQAANDQVSMQAYTLAKLCNNDREDDRELQFVVTNSARPARVVTSEGIHLLPNQPVDRSAIKSTVGAGDNHVAGYWMGRQLGLNEWGCLDLAGAFARAVIQIPEARLNRTAQCTVKGVAFKGPIAGIDRTTLGLIARKP